MKKPVDEEVKPKRNLWKRDNLDLLKEELMKNTNFRNKDAEEIWKQNKTLDEILIDRKGKWEGKLEDKYKRFENWTQIHTKKNETNPEYIDRPLTKAIDTNMTFADNAKNFSLFLDMALDVIQISKQYQDLIASFYKN